MRYFQQTYLNQKLITHLPIARALKKYSMSNFALVILDFPTKENLHISEQRFLDLLTPEYNVLSTAGLRTGKKIKRNSMSEEQKEK